METIPKKKSIAAIFIYLYYYAVQLYTDRQKVLKSDKERELWCSINYDYTTEESEQEDDDGQLQVNQHLLLWRSHSRFIIFCAHAWRAIF